MDLIADILLIAGAAGAAFYCIVLSRRLSRFTDLENGMGGAIAVLSAQVDEMTRTLARAQGSAHGSTETLAGLTGRAEDVARRLELLVASMHDLPTVGDPPAAARPTGRAGPPAPGKDDTSRSAGARGAEEPIELPAGIFRRHRSVFPEAAE